jgi:hypothetical protein
VAKEVIEFRFESKGQPTDTDAADSVLLQAVHADPLYAGTHLLHVFFNGPASAQEMEGARLYCWNINLHLTPFEDDPNGVRIET